MTYQLVQGDQAPQIQAVIKRADDGSAIDFSGGSCALKFRGKRYYCYAIYPGCC